MAGIRKLYEEVADLYAVMIQLHLEMLATRRRRTERRRWVYIFNRRKAKKEILD